MISLAYWYLLPLGVIISVIALSAGISGSNFWIPVYLLLLGIDAKPAFWLALLTMLFGFGSGVARNIFQKTIAWDVAGTYILIALPSAVLGAFLVPYAPSRLLLLVFSAFVMAYGIYLISSYFLNTESQEQTESHERIFWGRALIAGFLKGLIATGLGKLILPGILHHKKIRTSAEAVGTTTAVIFIVNCGAVVARMTPGFVSVLGEQGPLLWHTMAWVAPGVVIGGQIGPRLALKVPKRLLRPYVGCVLVAVGVLILMRAFA